MESENLQKSRSELIDELLKKYFGFNGFYGFIYFITDGEFIKIGRTSGSVLKRMEQLQTGNARLLKIAGVAIFQQYGFGKPCRAYALNDLEYLYHDFFSENWARGEWFEISEDDLKKCAGISTADDILYKNTFAVVEQRTQFSLQGATVKYLQF